MPPKKKQEEWRVESEESFDLESAVRSPEPAATSVDGSSGMVTADHLQRILEANHRTMMEANERALAMSQENQREAMSAFIAALPTVTPRFPAPPPVSKPTPIKVPKWSEEENPFEFFSKYEKAQRHNGVAKDQCGSLLQVYLSGSAQAAYAQVQDDILDDFELVKHTMLQALGDTPEEADRRWWTLKRKSGESLGAFQLRMRATHTRRFYGIDSKEDMAEKILLSRFMYLLPSDCYDSVSAKEPKTAQEAAKLAQDFEERGSFSRRHLSGRSSGSLHYQPYTAKREPGSSGAVVSNAMGNAQDNPSNQRGSASSPPRQQSQGSAGPDLEIFERGGC